MDKGNNNIPIGLTGKVMALIVASVILAYLAGAGFMYFLLKLINTSK